MNIEEFIKSVEQLEKEKGIPSETIIAYFEQSIASGYQREFKDINKDAQFRAVIDQDSNTISLWTVKSVVEEVMPGCESFEVTLDEAKLVKPDVQLDEEIEVPFYPSNELSRMAITYAKQIFIQKLKEAEKQAILDQYSDKIGEIVTAVVEKVEPNFVTIDLGKTFAILKRRDLIPNEILSVGQHIRVFISNVEGVGGSHINVSRSDSGLVRRLFEQEVHEIYEGAIMIKAIAREAGIRTKVAVMSNNPNIDATGSCIGQRGARIINISNQINGEKIDVFEFIDDAALFILESVKPATALGLVMNEGTTSALVVVKSDELSLAIGKSGFNVRLASKITGWNLEVKSEEWAKENGISFVTPEMLRLAYYARKKEKVRADLERREQEKNATFDEAATYEAYANAVEADQESEEEESEDAATATNIVKEVKEPVISKKEEEVKPAVKVEAPKVVVEEKVVIRGGTNITLSDLERRLESEKNRQAGKATRRKFEKEEPKKKKEEDDDDKLRQEELARSYMPVYTEEELAELEAEDGEEDSDEYDFDLYEEE